MITVAQVNGGVRNNIIPEEVTLIGTIRTLDVEMQKSIHSKIHRTVVNIAESARATAEVSITQGNPITYNDPKLTAKMLASLEIAAGEENVRVTVASTGAEDLCVLCQRSTLLLLFSRWQDPKMSNFDVAPHHTPDFYLMKAALFWGLGVLSASIWYRVGLGAGDSLGLG